MGSSAFGNWPLVALGSLTSKIRSGATPKGGQAAYLPTRDRFVLVRSQNVFDHNFDTTGLANISDVQAAGLHGAELQPSDVLLNITGDGVTFGRACLIPESVLPACVNQHVVLIRANETELHAGYLAAWLALPETKSYIESFNAGGSRRAITKGHIESFRLPLPPLHVQNEIGELAASLNSRIDLLRQTNTTLEAIAQALFKSWFVDFDPVHAKAEGREPEAMDAATAPLFPREFEASELGLIPKGWRLTRVGEIAELVKGCSYKGAGLSEGAGAYMFNLGCFNAKRIFATEKIKRYTGTYREQHAVIEGDLIVANTDMTQHREILGRPLFVPNGCEPGFISHHVFEVAPVLPNAVQWKQFLFFAFQQPEFRERAVGYATGTTVLALARDSAEKCPIVDPGEALLTSFSELATPLLSQIANNLQREKSLEQLRDTLLPRLISGKLRLRETTETTEAALA